MFSTEEAQILRKEEEDTRRRNLYFPQVMRDARRIGEYYPGLSPYSPESMDKLGVSLAHCESQCQNFYDAAEVERVFYPEMEKLLLEFFPDATDALVAGLNDAGFAIAGSIANGRRFIRVSIGSTWTEDRHVDALRDAIDRLA